MTSTPPPPASLDGQVRTIGRAALTVMRAHPGCGAIADLVHAVSRFPGAAGIEVEAAAHLEDAKDEAYREVWRLKRTVRELRARVTELEQIAIAPAGLDGEVS